MIVVVGGPPGGGKTTAAERFAQANGYHLVSAGLRFREMAKARGMDLAAFGRLAEADHEIDRELDRAVLEEILRFDATGRDVIVDGRIQAHLLAQRRVPCVRILITAPLEVRAERIAGREHTSAETAKEGILRREASEQARYRAIYGIDVRDERVYELIIDSSHKAPDEIVALMKTQVEG